MAPLSRSEHSDNAFTAARFTQPLRDELDEVMPHVIPRKRVNFGSVTIVNTEPEYYHEEDVATKWFNKDELNSIRLGAKDLSKGLLAARENGECRLSTAHHKISLMLKKDLQRLIKLSPSTPDQDLRRWCATTDGRRGLERFSSRDYGLLRRRDINKSRQAVFEEQSRQRELGSFDDEEIAKGCRLHSRRARTFAIFFGEADAATSRQESREGPPERAAPPRKRSRIGGFSELDSLTSAHA